MSIAVRRLEAKDKSVWLKLFKGYIEFYKATVPEDVIETTWQRLMAGAGDFHIAFVAVDGTDSPIGLAHVLFHRS
ncbi:MAG TPA: GNAT family N-acetyltransferase, partial [Hyphomicrobiaceae bacterium]|nr:GNAT family N-acetyltransferase [Hyphomicrobiaceae bacterium]